MAQLSLTNVVNVSVSAANPGVNAYNTSNLAVITGEPVVSSVQTISFSAVAASGAFTLHFASGSTSSIAYNAPLATIQTDINAVTGLANVVVSGSIASQSLILTWPGNLGPIPAASASANTLETSGSVAIVISFATASSGWSGGTLGYAIYNTPTQVGADFGTSSRTFQQANAVFSQQPNILLGGGQFIAILRQVAQQTLTFSGVAASGALVLQYNGNNTASIAWNATPAQIQTALQAVAGLSKVQVVGSIPGELVTVIFDGVYGPSLPLSASTNTLETSGSTSISITFANSIVGESFGAAITRTQGLVNYFGVMPNETLAVIGQTDLLAAAAIIQPLNLIGFFVSYNSADIQPGGMIDLLESGDFSQNRGLYYGDSSSSGVNAVIDMASYAGRALSTNFNGSNTTSTMHLKQLIGVQPDPSMTQTILNLAQAAGADCYVSLEGDSAVFTSGANTFFDDVYNLLWAVGALQVNGFNYLAQTSTKVPQTESGMDGLKGAYRNVCQQAVSNGYLAPGAWTSPTTFGNQALFLQNIAQYGYYIYSAPISQQLQTARAARQAPLVQIAFKLAGAIQSSDVVVYVNP